MRYTHNYSKLKNIKYTTIRRHNYGYSVGMTTFETYPGGEHRAEILDIKRKTLNSLSVDFLCKDTGCETREEAYKLFKSFYMKPINFRKEKFYIFYLKKLA